MTIEADPFAAPISKRRPLLGTTILLVEDSRFCSEAVRLMAMKTGARLRRADCVTSARRHLSMYCPDLIMIDLGLPDGSGLDLIRELSATDTTGQSILAMSGSVSDETRSAVMAAGADGFLAKPVGNLKHFQKIIEAALSGNKSIPGFSPQMVSVKSNLNEQALLDDLNHIRDMLEQALPAADAGRLRYCAQFVSSVAQSAHDPELMHSAGQFFQRMNTGGTGKNSGQNMLELLKEKLNTARGPLCQSRNVA